MKIFKKQTDIVSWLTIVGLLVSFIGLPAQANAATTVYQYEWVDQSGNVSKDGLAHEYNNLQPGQTITLSLTIINRSGTTIKPKSKLAQSPGKQVPVGTWGIGSQTPFQDGTPSFLDSSSFVLNNNRFVYYDGERSMESNGDIPNKTMLNFSWTIKLKNNLANGVYKLYVRPVCEYLAWTRQVKNGKLLPTTSSDIFWKFRVGGGDDSDVPTGYVRYVNPKYGFQFVYKQPVYPDVFKVEDNPGKDLLYGEKVFQALLGPLEGANPFASMSIRRSQDLDQTVSILENYFNTTVVDSVPVHKYVKSHSQRNGIDWTVFVYESSYGPGEPYGETRIGKLPSGYILVVSFGADSRSAVDQILLNSVKPIDNQVYINSQYRFSVDYPLNWEAKELDARGPVTLVGFRPNTMGSDYQWAINIFSTQNTTVGEIIDDFGDQFSDRVQNSNPISFNGIEATRTMTTTNQWPNWYSETITFVHNGFIYSISNGAIFNDNFDDFYKSFQFI